MTDDTIAIAGIHHIVGDRSCPCCYDVPEDCDLTDQCHGLLHFHLITTTDGHDVVIARCDRCRKRR